MQDALSLFTGPNTKAEKFLEVYVDGSFMQEKAKWAFIVVEGETVIYSERGTLEGEINSMRQIGGELKAVIQAVCYARRVKIPVKIHYDYNGIYRWVCDLFGEKAWGTNNEWTTKYRKFILENAPNIHSFVKVKAHSGNKWNEEVDKIAGSA